MSGSGSSSISHDNNATPLDEGLDIDTQFENTVNTMAEGRINDGETAHLRLQTSLDRVADIESQPGSARSQGSSRSSTESNQKQQKLKVVAWRDLPKKNQLIVITLARLSEPLVQTSLQSYMFYQLKWFDSSLPDSTISGQAGILSASFTAAQFLTAMVWGRVADSPRVGRKRVILIGLVGTLISCLGFGLSTSFLSALFFRCLGGATSGNTGVLRTMYQSRAFLLMPMTFNVGIIVGPVLGGLLSDPAASYPGVFGSIQFFNRFPYALPNLVSAGIALCALVGVWLCLEETHDALRGSVDYGRVIAIKIGQLLIWRREKYAYKPLHSHSSSINTVEMSPTVEEHPASLPRPRYTQKLPFRRIFTRNVSMTLVSQFLIAFHLGTFNALWFVFLSTPVYNPSDPNPPGFRPSLPFRFTGGLGLPSRSVGFAMAMLGVIGISMQLFLYPRLSSRFGTPQMWRFCLFLFPMAYTLLPYLSIIPSTTPPPGQKTGPWIWLALLGVLFIQVTGRTFALPAQTILVNNCTPHPSVLGTVHGMGMSISSLARTVGPVLCGYLYGLGLSHGAVGAVFWGLAVVACCGIIASFWVREGDGHEIWLEGDAEDEGEEAK
ncbi:hypothetical protein PFICI_06440 [Pestalotiopsis fici W106-1]|uniref:Major facilitator superfamily (MFS) profile domain-containing protein n=1 Tax=Pestalotiopsis fici (strain W106-1 / CGMCC3.15140) TaxID=1229662 RepID=W3X5N6_PESFW|nr:uncharacterized protein PFICI_06440 [Pestalotiopsis fici W106-1]ETS81438.1 hypothetical protein PFICI_06440 [Pestalotiopsis fici W106-1]